MILVSRNYPRTLLPFCWTKRKAHSKFIFIPLEISTTCLLLSAQRRRKNSLKRKMQPLIAMSHASSQKARSLEKKKETT